MAEVRERSLSPERIAYLAQSRIPEIIFCNTALLAIATAGLLVRLFVRIRYLTGINLDDLLCLTSWVGLLAPRLSSLFTEAQLSNLDLYVRSLRYLYNEYAALEETDDHILCANSSTLQ